MNDDMQSKLQTYYANAFPSNESLTIKSLTSISAGWESDVYSFVAEHGPSGDRQREDLILRVYPGDDAYQKSAREFHGMNQLYKAGYSVPRVILLERDDSPFGKPFMIMEKIDGQMLLHVIDNAPEDEKKELLTLFCELMVQLHRLDWRPYVDDVARYDTGDPYTFVDRWLDFFRPYLKQFPPSEGFMRVFKWLEDEKERVPCSIPAPVHQDFHPANVLLKDNGTACVIDWTQLDISDPRFDLAWTLILFSKASNCEHRDYVLHEYERLSGGKIEQLDYFEVGACFKRLGSVVFSLIYGPEKFGMRPEAVEAMKQGIPNHKVVYDLLMERTGIRVPEIEEMFAAYS